MTSTPTMREALEELDFIQGKCERAFILPELSEQQVSEVKATKAYAAFKSRFDKIRAALSAPADSKPEWNYAKEVIAHENAHPPTDSKPVASAFIESVLYNLDHKRQGSTHEEAAMVIRQLLFEQKKAHPPADSLEAAIKELPEGVTLEWRCFLVAPNFLHNPYGFGETPLAALLDGIDEMKRMHGSSPRATLDKGKL